MNEQKSLKGKAKNFFSDKRKRLAVILSGAGVVALATVVVVVFTFPVFGTVADERTEQSSTGTSNHSSSSNLSSSGTSSSNTVSSGTQKPLGSSSDGTDVTSSSSNGTGSGNGNSNSGNTGSSSNGSTGSNSNGGSTSGSTGGNSNNGGGSSQTHTHSFTDPIFDSVWVETVPAQPEVPEQGHWVGYYLSGDANGPVKFYTFEEYIAWVEANNYIPSWSTGKEWVVDIPYQPGQAAQGYWEYPLVGYRCWCGVADN